MFRGKDKTTLVGVNAKDINDELLNYIINFPIEDEEFEIPEELKQISILEGYTDDENDGFKIAFKIFVGKKAKFIDVAESKVIMNVTKAAFKSINSINDQVCYCDANDTNKVFAVVENGDIVVDNIDQLRETLLEISDNFRDIKKSIKNVRKLANRV